MASEIARSAPLEITVETRKLHIDASEKQHWEAEVFIGPYSTDCTYHAEVAVGSMDDEPIRNELGSLAIAKFIRSLRPRYGWGH